ncbi:MAG TPA: polysaccharide biosynthesis C-terminal domain-containing protein [Bacteroidia bacterium]|nr:polysaccharide biosynthesis C-terminal domain-containing protein [Bacteroidia bacterium]
MANPLKKLAGQTAIYGLSTIVPRFLNYLLVPLLTYKFTNPSDFGVNTEIYAYISFLNVILTYGMETAFFNFVTKNENKNVVYSTALISLLSTTTFFALLGFFSSEFIANKLGYANNVNFIQWMVFIIATDALMAIPFARLRAEQRPLKFAFIKLANIIVNLCITIFFIHFCKNAYEQDLANQTSSTLGKLYNPQIGIGYAFLATLLANLFSLLLLAKQFVGFTYTFDKKLWTEMIRYALPLLVVGLAGMINETFDRIILKKLLPAGIGMHALGVYGACYKISILMTIFRQAFQYAAEPFFFNHAKQEDSRKLNALVMKYFIITCSFLFLATMMNIRWIKYFVNENYWEGLGVVPILLIANLCLGIYYNLSVWYKLTGQTKFGAFITIFGAAITLAINFIFIPRYSYMASAWATLASYGCMMVISYFLSQKYYPTKYNVRSFVFFFGFALAFYFASLLWKNAFSNRLIELGLNNILLLIYCWLFIKFELPNLKRANATG